MTHQYLSVSMEESFEECASGLISLTANLVKENVKEANVKINFWNLCILIF
jgi:hypothetical protein